jgi:hypothetical protein
MQHKDFFVPPMMLRVSSLGSGRLRGRFAPIMVIPQRVQVRPAAASGVRLRRTVRNEHTDPLRNGSADETVPNVRTSIGANRD